MIQADDGPQPAAPTLFESDESVPGRSKLKLVVAYDGTDFHGFAAQPDVRTVEGVLAKVLEKILRHEVDIVCAGRTDAGVHAWAQVVSFDADPGLDPDRLRSSLTGVLAPEVVIRSCEFAPPGFDARRSATSRTYRYTIVNRADPDPFLARYAWWMDSALDFPTMRTAADPFIGEHDFAAFCRKPKSPRSSATRRVSRAEWADLGDGIVRFEVTANAFCWQMVRSIVGTMVDVGLGKLRAGDIRGILDSGDRSRAGQVAPPHGLSLWDVAY